MLPQIPRHRENRHFFLQSLQSFFALLDSEFLSNWCAL